MSIMPAFSPGPCSTCLLRVGSRFKCTRDDLYEQCSLHITLKMPSSVSVGSRPPSSCLIFSNSSDVRPCSWMSSGVRARVADKFIGALKFYCRTATQIESSEFLPVGWPRAMPSNHADGEATLQKAADYTVLDEIHHRRHGRTHRPRKNRADQSSDRH